MAKEEKKFTGKTTSKAFTGTVTSEFKRKGKSHIVDSTFSTFDKFTFDYLISTKRIKE